MVNWDSLGMEVLMLSRMTRQRLNFDEGKGAVKVAHVCNLVVRAHNACGLVGPVTAGARVRV
jgi:hypothetical protein